MRTMRHHDEPARKAIRKPRWLPALEQELKSRVGWVDEAAGVRIRHAELAIFKIDLEADRSSLLSDDGTTVNAYAVDANGQPAAESLYDAIAKQWTLKVWLGNTPTQSSPKTVVRPVAVSHHYDSTTTPVSP